MSDFEIPGGGGGAVDSVNGEVGTVVLTTDDISDSGQTNKWATAAEKTKLGYISVTQAVDLDAIETQLNSKLEASDLSIINVKDYGAVGDDATDDYAAITAAIAASSEGDIIYFPKGIYRTSASIILKRNRTYRGTHSPRWFYRGGDVCSIKPHASFSGDQILYIPDKEITSDANDNDGGRIENICVNGNSAGSTVIGIRFHGLVRDWYVKDVDVSQTSGNGFSAVGYTRVDTNTYYPRGLNFSFVSVYSAGNSGGAGNGFVLNQATDSTFTNCLAVNCESIGFLIDSPGETKFVDCRSVFNNSDGFRVTGASTVGGVQFIGCSTDRNGKYGIQITATGDQPIQIVGMLTRRDGSTATGNLAGVGIVGTVGNTVCPVNIYGLDQTIGYDDGGGGTQSPAYGVYATYSKQVTATGTAWGVTAGAFDGGNNAITNMVLLKQKTGTSGTYDTFPYHGNMGIGVQDASKRLHVKDSSANAGVRTENTTNSVIGEMRSDTSQFFVGTISNHDIRLFTNGTSRLAITNTALQPNTNDAITLGTTSNQFSDLFLAEGGVINWDNGDVTITQTGNELAIAGGVLKVGGLDVGVRTVAVQVSGSASGDTALATGDGLATFAVDSTLNGMNLVAVKAYVTTVSSSGAPLFQVRRSRRSSATARTIVDMLSTGVSIDANEFESADAATAAVINTSNDDVQTGDIILIDCDTAGTGTKGAQILLTFQLP